MQVETYDERTRKSIEEFLKESKQAITSEIVRLGGKKRVVNWQTLKLVLSELKHEGAVRETRIGSKVILYEWIGDNNGVEEETQEGSNARRSADE